jgi:hypothetical protein
MCGRFMIKIHTFNTGWMRVVCFIFWPLNPWKKSPLYPSERKLGQPQYQLGCIYEEKSLSQPPEINLGPPAQNQSLHSAVIFQLTDFMFYHS